MVTLYVPCKIPCLISGVRGELWWKQHLSTYQTVQCIVTHIRNCVGLVYYKEYGLSWPMLVLAICFTGLLTIVHTKFYMSLYVSVKDS